MNVLDFLDITFKALYHSSTVLQTATILKRCKKSKLSLVLFFCKVQPLNFKGVELYNNAQFTIL